ncbi:MAG: AEC family transporter [Candidatus Omnitrophica bacterium]|nr:AEC family transporter [Candidatus Omnitrophota bacterium]
MGNMFSSTFFISFFAIVEVLIPALIGFLSIKAGIVKAQLVDYLSELVINITLPLMIFTHIIEEFSFSTLGYWWIFPLVSLGMIVTSYFLAEIVVKITKYNRNQLEFKTLVSFQNSGYLPLALVSALLKKEEASLVMLYIIFFLMGFNLVIWSWGVYAFREKIEEKFSWMRLFSPPFLAVLFSLVLLPVKRIIPQIFLNPFRILGNTTVPLGMFIVGASLANCKFGVKLEKEVFITVFLRLIVIPFFCLCFLYFLKIPPLISFTILLESTMPSATSLVVIANVYGGNREYISQSIFLSHLISLVTIPLFLSLFNIFFKVLP